MLLSLHFGGRLWPPTMSDYHEHDEPLSVGSAGRHGWRELGLLVIELNYTYGSRSQGLGLDHSPHSGDSVRVAKPNNRGEIVTTGPGMS
ncbi:hypothetical protein EYF80_033434 [Liparis tanakae]|uniref:Uncharacterized protein n=1 Tax=Liparis tanakae TaxID=230148 RepID=A0A4Z2GUA7_9TELE|nr:hypothetical protein EYF80_033434 [Liparis tanakae]